MVIIIGGVLLISQPLAAAPGFDLDKVTLDVDAQAGERTREVLTINPEWDWGWLRLDATARLYLSPAEENYSSVKTRLYLPEIANRLKLDLDYQWNERYQLAATAAAYSWDLKDLKFNFETEVGDRAAVGFAGSTCACGGGGKARASAGGIPERGCETVGAAGSPGESATSG